MNAVRRGALAASVAVLLACAACSSDSGASAGPSSPSPTSSAGSAPSTGSRSTIRATGTASATPAPTAGRSRVAASTATPTRAPIAGGGSSRRLGSWEVGLHPLPLRPDGFGRVLPTPRVLRDRRLPTRDLLPPPADGNFHARIGPLTPAVRRRMGETWSPGCPIGLADLRYVEVSFRGFDGRAHTGELVVAASVADQVVRVFRTLFAASFPIEEMRLPTTADLRAAPTGDGNDTAAYVCRFTRGTTTFSAHAYGLAIDVDPFDNPYRRDEPAADGGDLVIPELASAYLDRSWRRPGMILPGGVVTRAFASVGWSWGGDFSTVSDLMHFSANGR